MLSTLVNWNRAIKLKKLHFRWDNNYTLNSNLSYGKYILIYQKLLVTSHLFNFSLIFYATESESWRINPSPFLRHTILKFISKFFFIFRFLLRNCPNPSYAQKITPQPKIPRYSFCREKDELIRIIEVVEIKFSFFFKFCMFLHENSRNELQNLRCTFLSHTYFIEISGYYLIRPSLNFLNFLIIKKSSDLQINHFVFLPSPLRYLDNRFSFLEKNSLILKTKVGSHPHLLRFSRGEHHIPYQLWQIHRFFRPPPSQLWTFISRKITSKVQHTRISTDPRSNFISPKRFFPSRPPISTLTDS